jgi:hypothetical protein
MYHSVTQFLSANPARRHVNIHHQTLRNSFRRKTKYTFTAHDYRRLNARINKVTPAAAPFFNPTFRSGKNQ